MYRHFTTRLADCQAVRRNVCHFQPGGVAKYRPVNCVRIIFIMDFPHLFLASNSPRRKELLSWLGIPFIQGAFPVDETPNHGEPAAEYVVRLAREKNLAVQQAGPVRDILLTADTIVVDGEDLLGKPRNNEEARAMLRRLRGRTHYVLTGLGVFDPRSGNLLEDRCVSSVPMRSYSDSELNTYVQSGDPLDKAGGYAIQHEGFHPVEGFAGCFASVMGLPLCHLLRTLKKIGLITDVDIPAACLKNLGYRCSLSHAVLQGKDVG